MRNLLSHSFSILVLSLVLTSENPLQAQSTSPKLATIDLKKVFDGYWKTKQADSTLKERAADFEKAKKGMVEDYQKSNEDYKKLIESANDVAVSLDEKEKRKQAAEKKLLEIREIESSINTFDRQSRTTLSEQQRRMRDKILGEVKEVISSTAKADAYTLVIDTAAESMHQAPVFLYWDGKADLTEKVLSQLNSTAPAPKESTDVPAAKPAEKK